MGGQMTEEELMAEIARKTRVATVIDNSAQPCGCDKGADWLCDYHRDKGRKDAAFAAATKAASQLAGVLTAPQQRELVDQMAKLPAPGTSARPQLFPDSAQGRKDHPVFTGVLMYFPDAIAAVAHVSKKGNDQHNPGQPLHWAREKSTDQTDTATRHMMDHGVGNIRDTDGEYHLAKAAWRILAELQLTIEREREKGR